MIVIYNTVIFFLSALFKIASLLHPKARLFVKGRVGITALISEKMRSNASPVVWVHCASLGEFEQGRPLMEAIKKERPHYKIVLTFFSPSGYEVRKNYEGADYVFYLPWDTAKNAKIVVSALKPSLAVFIKYEFWFHYSCELKNQNIPLLSVSSIFRREQIFFKWYGRFYQNILRNFSHFFVQNDQSKKLLHSIGVFNTTVTGDTRFDRVHTIATTAQEIPIAKLFKGDSKVMVIGSCWKEDLMVLLPFIRQQNQLKFIIVPHQISEQDITHIEKNNEHKYIRYSQLTEEKAQEYSMLIIDNVGMLSKLYRYADFAYVGGAFGKGLHNILEAACYGIPIFFGNKNYKKFKEAVDLIERGGAFAVSDTSDFAATFSRILHPEQYKKATEITQQYVHENLGATEKIMSYCKKIKTL